MYFPQFLMGMFATSFIVAIWADMETGSVWKALGWALLAIVILQVGYIGLVVRLIYKRESEGIEGNGASDGAQARDLRRDRPAL
jgi:exopolysaccharide production repressor protein